MVELLVQVFIIVIEMIKTPVAIVPTLLVHMNAHVLMDTKVMERFAEKLMHVWAKFESYFFVSLHDVTNIIDTRLLSRKS